MSEGKILIKGNRGKRMRKKKKNGKEKGKKNKPSAFKRAFDGFKSVASAASSIWSVISPFLISKNATISYCKSGKLLYHGAHDSLPSSISAVPLSLGSSISSSQPTMTSMANGGLKMVHTCYVGELTVTSATVPGDVLMNLELHPGLLPVVWLNKLAGLYERFKLLKVAILYTPTVSAATDGTILGYYERDPDNSDTISNGQTTVAGALAHLGAASTSVYTPHVWGADISDMGTKYMTINGTDARFNIPAEMTIMSSATFASNLTLGTVQIALEIEFTYPDESDQFSGSAQFFYNDGAVTATDAFSGSTPLPITDDYDQTLRMNLQIRHQLTSDSYGVCSMPPGYYLISGNVTGTGLIAVNLYCLGSYEELMYSGTIHYTYKSISSTSMTYAFAFQSTGIYDNSIVSSAGVLGGIRLGLGGTTYTDHMFSIHGLPGAPAKYGSLSAPYLRQIKKLVNEALLLKSKEDDESEVIIEKIRTSRKPILPLTR